MTQQSAGEHDAALRHIILIANEHVFALALLHARYLAEKRQIPMLLSLI